MTSLVENLIQEISFKTYDSTDLKLKCIINNYPWWRQQMKIFSAILALCEGNLPVTGRFPHRSQWCGAFFLFDDSSTNG